jgi:hypothetical protein
MDNLQLDYGFWFRGKAIGSPAAMRQGKGADNASPAAPKVISQGRKGSAQRGVVVDHDIAVPRENRPIKDRLLQHPGHGRGPRVMYTVRLDDQGMDQDPSPG